MQGRNQLKFSRGVKMIVTCFFTCELRKVFGVYETFLHSYIVVNSVHTTYFYN